MVTKTNNIKTANKSKSNNDRKKGMTFFNLARLILPETSRSNIIQKQQQYYFFTRCYQSHLAFTASNNKQLFFK